ncbi:uncharacterized protein METZ01_LOCUS419989, partial [marine metagenome]
MEVVPHRKFLEGLETKSFKEYCQVRFPPRHVGCEEAELYGKSQD